jgi:lipoyl(octanoyl) transferase
MIPKNWPCLRMLFITDSLFRTKHNLPKVADSFASIVELPLGVGFRTGRPGFFWRYNAGMGNEPSPRPLHWAFLGRVSYPDGVLLQSRIRSAIRSGEVADHLLLLEHPHVYTLGRSASRADLVLDERERADLGVEVAEADRGGQVTYHGPGQLVGYPILDLNPDRRDVRRYVRDLQAVLVGILKRFEVDARGGETPERVGVWVEDRKIASIGVHLSRWITTHGFALNVATDLALFGGIVPCGLPGVAMTSIAAETGSAPDLEEVARICAFEFAGRFDRRLVPAPDLRQALGRPAAMAAEAN